MAEKSRTVIIKNDLMEAYERLSTMDESKKTEEIKAEEAILKSIIKEMGEIDDRIFDREIKKRRLDLIIQRYSKHAYQVKKLKPVKKEVNRTLREKINLLSPLIFLFFAVIIFLALLLRT